MAQVDWYIEGVEFTNCNCDYGCPCQFESRRPTHGDCRGFAAVRIDKGHFGDVALDGLGASLLYAWPGPIYEGNGECQAVIDERADGKQRDALATVLYGGETNEGATHWWVYRKMSSTVHPPLFKHIEFDVNIEHRKARIVITDVLESTARPIRSPATGGEHRVRINLPKAQEEQQVQDEIDKFACEFAEHASEAVGMVYACLKVGEEFKHALKDPTKVMSPKEIAFCGFGAIGQFEKKVSILDPIGWAAGKEGSLVCKGTIAVKNWIQGNAVEDFLDEDYDRVQKQRKIWCTNYGATLDEFGHCWDLEIDYDNCAKAQTFWTTTEPEKYGLADQSFKFPCPFPPIPAPEDQVCTEVNSYPIDPSAGSGG